MDVLTQNRSPDSFAGIGAVLDRVAGLHPTVYLTRRGVQVATLSCPTSSCYRALNQQVVGVDLDHGLSVSRAVDTATAQVFKLFWDGSARTAKERTLPVLWNNLSSYNLVVMPELGGAKGIPPVLGTVLNCVTLTQNPLFRTAHQLIDRDVQVLRFTPDPCFGLIDVFILGD